MSTAAAIPALPTAPPMPTGPARRLPVDPLAIHAGQRVVLHGIDWATYMAISDAAGNRRLHIAYDGRVMELMPISMPHGRYEFLFARMIAALTDEMQLPLMGCGSFTLNREDLAKGIEPNQCFYIENAARVRAADQIELGRDPPPDLALEVDITSSSINRLGIYEAIGVPEVWRFDGTKIECRRRQPDGKYRVTEVSGCLPKLRPSSLLQFIDKRHDMDDNALIRDLRAWVKDQIAHKWGAAERLVP